MAEWHHLERNELLAAQQADAMATGDSLTWVAVVRQQPDADTPIEFDTYRPGADLVYGNFPYTNALGAVNVAAAAQSGSLLTHCNVPAGAADVRHPAASYDGKKVAFAMRTSQTDTLDIYEVTLDAAQTCTKVTDGNGKSVNGILLHNTDPQYAPDGTLVFASTRGKGGNNPTRSLKFLLPQTDLWRMKPAAGGGYQAPEQMTALLGSELSPAMMLNGQMSFTAEKASADFYQLSGRRINWDLTDYHPLLGQRAQSPGLDGQMHPSVGYQQVTDIREGLDRNFLIILSDTGAKGGGGTLATFNRSIGPFEADRMDLTFLHSMTILDPAATGRAGATQGAYRSPYPLPDGRILVSYAPAVTDLAAATSVRWDVVVLDPVTGARTNVGPLSGGAQSHLDAIVVYKREPRTLFDNVQQLIFGGHGSQPDAAHAVLHFPDLPMLGTLLGANLRTGRFVDQYRPATQVVVYEDTPPPASGTPQLSGTQMVYQNRMMLGAVPLASDGSAELRLPSLTPLVFELQDAKGNALFTMSEEDQLGPGEYISRGVPQKFFNSVCGGCHGSVDGTELDIDINADALTGASVSIAHTANSPAPVGP